MHIICAKKLQSAHVAQSVEHFLGKGEVTGSSPVAGSTLLFPWGRVACLIKDGKIKYGKRKNNYIFVVSGV